MIKVRRKTALLVGLAWLAIVASTASAGEKISTQVDIPYDLFTLDNGLTVIVHSDHSTPTVFVGMWYGVGSKDEPEGKTGFAHLFEHLMFQSSENHDGEYFAPFKDAGATGMNGTTNADRTNYFATVPSGALDMALWMESDRMANLLGAVTQDVLDEQRGVVQNEKRQRETAPYAQEAEKRRAGIYPVDHPYRHSTIGSMEDLNAASLEDVQEWFKTYYGGSNAVLVLVGDITLEDAKAKVQHYFGEAPSGEPLSHPKAWVPQLPENRVEVMYDRVGQTYITRAWPMPGLTDKDATLALLLADSLAGSKNAPLRKKLVDDLQLATSVKAHTVPNVLSSEFHVDIYLRMGATPQQVLPIVDEVLAEYLAAGPEQQLLDNARLRINMDILSTLERPSFIGMQLAEGYLYSGNPLFVNSQLERLYSATSDELRQVADRWLTRGYYQLTILPFPEYVEGEQVADRSAIPEVTANGEINFPDIEDKTLKNGMKLVVAKRGKSPLVNVVISLDTGGLAAPSDSPELADFVWNMLDKGTARFDASELAEARDRIGMKAYPTASSESLRMSYSILDMHLGESLELAAEALRNPTFPSDELEKEKARAAALFATIQRAPNEAARSLFKRAVYGADAMIGQLPTPETLARIDRSKLVAFHKSEIAPDNTTIYMIGNIDMATAEAAVLAAFGKWNATNRSALAPIGDAPEQRARVILVDYPGADSSEIMAGLAIDDYDANTWNELKIMNAVIGGGLGSRLSNNLREGKGWSYGYGSAVTPNKSGDMTFFTQGKVQADKTAESMQEIMRELVEFTGVHPVTDAEVDRQKLNLTRALPGSYETSSDFLRSILEADSYGLPYNYKTSEADRIAAVSTEGVAQRARDVIDTNKLTWIVVGDLERIETAVRALDYGPVEVWDAFGTLVR